MFDGDWHYDNFYDSLRELIKEGLTEEIFSKIVSSWSAIDNINNIHEGSLEVFEVLMLTKSEEIRGIKDVEEVKLYRASTEEGKNGYSWTSDIETARFFRGYRKSFRIMETRRVNIYTTTVRKEDIIFYTNNRRENEYVIRKDSNRKIELYEDE